MFDLNDLSCVTFIHLDLSLAKCLVFRDKCLILALQESHLLSQLLHLACRLSLDILGNLLVLGLSKALQSLILLLQLLVLIAQLCHLLSISLGAGGVSPSEPFELTSHLRVLLDSLLVRLIESFVLGDHALFVLQHQVQVLELLR